MSTPAAPVLRSAAARLCAALAAALAACDGATFIVDLPNPVDTLVVAPGSLSLLTGDTATLSAQALDPLGLVVPVTVQWTSLQPAVATVSPDGLVTAVAAGSTEVRAAADTLATTVPVEVRTDESITVSGSGRRFGPLPVITFALADDATGADLYPLGAGEQPGLFGLFDTGSTRLRLYNETPYDLVDPGDPDQGLIPRVPHRLTDGNYFSSDVELLGMSSEEIVRVRLNGLGAIDETTLEAPFGSGTAQLEVAGVPALPQPSDPRMLNVTLVGGRITQSVVAVIDYTTAVVRGPYDFYPGLDDRTEAGTGVAGFAPVTAVRGPDITFFGPGDAAIPELQLELRLRRFSTRWELIGLELRHGTASYVDSDLAAPPWSAFDTGTTITIIGDQVAGTLGLAPGGGSFDCLSGTANGHVVDQVAVHGVNGSYRLTDASVCWDQASLEPSQAVVVGSNLFDQVPVVFDGPADELRIGPATPSPVQWSGVPGGGS